MSLQYVTNTINVIKHPAVRWNDDQVHIIFTVQGKESRESRARPALKFHVFLKSFMVQ